MTTVGEIDAKLRQWAPAPLAESWDNTGLLLGDPQARVVNLMTCLTVTPPVVAEAIRRHVSLIVTHHPLPFRPLRSLTTNDDTGRLLWHLACHRVSLLSLHTRYDSARDGINQQLAEFLQLEEVQALEQKSLTDDANSSQEHVPSINIASPQTCPVGRGRWGVYSQPRPILNIADTLKQKLRVQHLQHVSSGHTEIKQVAIGCGSAGEFIKDARRLGCDLLVLGETNFHTCLEAQAARIDLLLVGHFASERFAQEVLAARLATELPATNVWCSESETDPIRWL
ncbi:MAG: Nif3-like dinuclear metal center hexameric protein [Planctomycetaceae bacterium]|nr:Nif3-like dinuclear metal center hexameric protein [Planctomycetaceae bacterium]